MDSSDNSHEKMNCSGNSHEEMNLNNNCDCNSPNCSCNIDSIPKIDDYVEPNIHIEMFNRYGDDINTYLYILDDICNSSKNECTKKYIHLFIYTISELLLNYYDNNSVIQYYIYDKKNDKILFSFNILDIMIHHLRKNVDDINNQYDDDDDDIFYINFVNVIKESIQSDGILNIVASYDGYLSSLIPIDENNDIVYKIYNMFTYLSIMFGSSYEMKINSIENFIQSIKYYCTHFNYELPEYFNFVPHINEVLEKNYHVYGTEITFDKYCTNFRFEEYEVNFKYMTYDEYSYYLYRTNTYLAGYGTRTGYGARNESNNNNYIDDYDNDDYYDNDYDNDDYYDNDYESDNDSDDYRNNYYESDDDSDDGY